MINFLSSIANVVGFFGVALLLIAFFLLNANKLTPLSMCYQWLNFFGAGFILFSLFFHWNLPAALIEVIWMTISLFGVVRAAKHSTEKTGVKCS